MRNHLILTTESKGNTKQELGRNGDSGRFGFGRCDEVELDNRSRWVEDNMKHIRKRRKQVDEECTLVLWNVTTWTSLSARRIVSHEEVAERQHGSLTGNGSNCRARIARARTLAHRVALLPRRIARL